MCLMDLTHICKWGHPFIIYKYLGCIAVLHNSIETSSGTTESSIYSYIIATFME